MTGEESMPVEASPHSIQPHADGYASASPVIPESVVDSETGRGDAERAPAVAYPSLKATQFYVDPAPSTAKGQTRLLHVQVTALREELLHGERSRLGVARNVRLIDRRIQEILSELAMLGDPDRSADGTDTERIGELLTEVSELRTHRVEIQHVSEAFVEAIDKFHIHSLLGDGATDSVLEDLLVEQDPPDSVRQAVRLTLESHREAVISGTTESELYDDMDAISEIYADLESLYEAASWRVTEAAATAATDVPFLIESVAEPARKLGYDISTFERVPVSSLGDILAERFAVATDVAASVAADHPEDASVSDLADSIRDAVAARTDRPSPERTLADLTLPLLDVPARDEQGGPPGVGESDASALKHTDTPIGYLLTGAFRTVGDFGGVVYRTPEGEWQWALNPWVADDPVDVAIDGVESYGRLWCHNFVAWAIAFQLDRNDRHPSAVACTLCAHSPDGFCGPSGCAFHDLRSGIDAALSCYTQ